MIQDCTSTFGLFFFYLDLGSKIFCTKPLRKFKSEVLGLLVWKFWVLTYQLTLRTAVCFMGQSYKHSIQAST